MRGIDAISFRTLATASPKTPRRRRCCSLQRFPRQVNDMHPADKPRPHSRNDVSIVAGAGARMARGRLIGGSRR
jgi:hypothetical protein